MGWGRGVLCFFSWNADCVLLRGKAVKQKVCSEEDVPHSCCHSSPVEEVVVLVTTLKPSQDDGLRGAEVWGGGKVTEDRGKRRDEFSGDQSSVQH